MSFLDDLFSNPRKPWQEVTEAVWRETLDLNLGTPFFLAKLLIPGMQEKRWGRVINIASLQSVRAFPNWLPYGASTPSHSAARTGDGGRPR
jgi:NAD(P)-dependent dehydrogenase (short-subunit alcohol dehydrogenase family)